MVAVAGRIQTGSYETPEGQRRYTTDVVADDVRFLEWGEARTGREPDADRAPDDSFGDIPGFNPLADTDGDDELPF